VRHVTKTFPGQVALNDVSLELRAGQVHALVGHNGSGKSTLVKVITGFHAPDPGATVEHLGEPVDVAATAGGWRDHVHTIHQDLGLVPTLSVIDNLALVHGYRKRPGGRIDWRAERRNATAILREFDVDIDPRTPVGELSRRDQAVVAIARAVSGLADDARGVLILDEPTATLPRKEVHVLFDAVRRAAARGCAVLFVSHRLSDVLEIGEWLTVLRDGRKVAERSVRGLTHESLVTLIVGTAIDRDTRRSIGAPVSSQAEEAISVSHLHSGKLRDFSFSAHRQETVGVAGLDGSGREDITRILAGLERPTAGEIRLDGVPVRISSPAAALAKGIALVPARRVPEGLVQQMSVSENITLPLLRTVTSRGRLSRRRENRDARTWIQRFDIKPADPHREVANLSGGNAQKVVVAKWLRTRPRILLLEEPTAGVDIGAKGAIWDMVADATRDGTTAVVTSSDWEELAERCDRVVVVANGRVQAVLVDDGITTDQIAHHALQEPEAEGVA